MKRSHLGNKTTRRALIRLRHVLAREKFIRWTVCEKLLTSFSPHRMREWHRWHALGCP